MNLNRVCRAFLWVMAGGFLFLGMQFFIGSVEGDTLEAISSFRTRSGKLFGAGVITILALRTGQATWFWALVVLEGFTAAARGLGFILDGVAQGSLGYFALEVLIPLAAWRLAREADAG
jgi:hypothetical protein